MYGSAILCASVLLYIGRDAVNASSASRLLANGATSLLYLSLLPSALNANFKDYFGKMWLVRNRKSMGITAFIFAAGHGFISFTKTVGGVEGLASSDQFFQITVILGMIAFDILLVLFATSSIFAMKKLGRHWKNVHRFVYLGGLLIIAHITLIRIYYSDIFSLMTIVYILLFTSIMILQLRRFFKYISRTKLSTPQAPTQS